MNTHNSQYKPLLTWKSHLASQSPARMVIVASILALLFVAASSIFGRFYGWIICGVCVLAILDFFAPVTYQITETGASMRGIRTCSVDWTDVKHVYVDDLGLKLSTLGNPSRLEAFRGLYLRYNGNKQQVDELVRELWKQSETI